MNATPLPFAGHDLLALPTGALWWPLASVLCVSDLHLGKSERLARRGGGLLPPYETRDTLARLADDITVCAPETVLCLGDSFDDLTAAQHLPPAEIALLAQLVRARKWIWIEGNHDDGPLPFGGQGLRDWTHQGISFRHIADGTALSEISGHYHPKARAGGRARACFLHNATRLILPAYGTYTGGLHCDAPALAAVMAPRAWALLTGKTMVTLPVSYPDTRADLP